DGSVIYGNNDESIRRVRTFKDGKLKIVGNGLFEHDEKGIPILRDVRNCWADFSLLQALFVREHNGMCDMLKTVELLKINILLAGMRINWYGFLGKKFKDMFGYVCGLILSGLVGFRKPKDHGVPYSLTKQFFSIYKMHSLLPNKFILRNIKSTTPKYECPLVSENKWEDLTNDNEVIEALRELIVLMTMMFKRLEADHFFTINFNSQTYAEKGLEWVNKTEALKDVIDRHFLDMTRKWMRCSSAFSVWDAALNKTNYIPLYLRLAP
ncbi:hypothetical protein SCA6_003751, partial [Theobroma cacao]